MPLNDLDSDNLKERRLCQDIVHVRSPFPNRLHPSLVIIVLSPHRNKAISVWHSTWLAWPLTPAYIGWKLQRPLYGARLLCCKKRTWCHSSLALWTKSSQRSPIVLTLSRARFQSRVLLSSNCWKNICICKPVIRLCITQVPAPIDAH